MECNICFDEIKNINNKEVLLCNHVFHYECIKSWYLTLKNSHVNNYTQRHECPYCRSYGGKLTYRGDKYMNDGIHKKPKCKKIVKSGTRCKNSQKYGEYCGIHKKMI